jgi:predicted nucleic acid-binding protein
MSNTRQHKKEVLKVIPEPEPNTRAVLVPAPRMSPVIKGTGDIDLLCGKCKETLVEGIVEGQIQNIVICCPKCKSYNEVIFAVGRWTPIFPKPRTKKEK